MVAHTYNPDGKEADAGGWLSVCEAGWPEILKQNHVSNSPLGGKINY